MPEIHAYAVDLNLLVALDALLQERSVSRAAARLGLTQSAMSHRLRRLREHFDDELFVGGKGGMVPTPRALSIGAPIRRGLLELDGALRPAEAFEPATSERRFDIISSDYAELVVLPRILERLGRDAPHICIALRPTDRLITQRLADGEGDLYVGIRLDAPTLMRLPVFEEGFASIVRTDHPRVRGRLDLDTFTSLSHIIVSGGEGPSAVDEALSKIGRERRVVLRLSRFAGLPHVIARSDLIATVPRGVAFSAAEYLPLQVLDPPLSLPRSPIDVCWHPRSNDDGGHRFVRTLIAEITRAAMHAYAPPRRQRARGSRR